MSSTVISMLLDDLLAELEEQVAAAVSRGCHRALREAITGAPSSPAEQAAPLPPSPPPASPRRPSRKAAPPPREGLAGQVCSALLAHPGATLVELRQHLADGGLEIDGRTLGRCLGGLRSSGAITADGPAGACRYALTLAPVGRRGRR